MKFKKVLAMGLAAALCITSLVGCSSNNASSNSSSTSVKEEETPKTGKKKVLPSTGEKMTPVIFLVGILGCAVAITVFRSKKLTK